LIVWGGRRRIFKQKKKKIRAKWNEAGEGVVVLHQFGRGKFCPNLSPFALKVESFLRLTGIKYVVDTDAPFGPKGKCPWITLNRIDTADSEFILERLVNEFGIDLESHLSKTEKASAEMARIVAEEQLFWCVIYWRYWLDQCTSFLKSQTAMFSGLGKYIFLKFITKSIRKKADAHGIGRHSEEEIFLITQKTLQILSDYLGPQSFFGGSHPCKADCAIFGQLSQLMWNAPDSKYEDLMKVNFPRLANYCKTMKDRLFPDWNDLLQA